MTGNINEMTDTEADRGGFGSMRYRRILVCLAQMAQDKLMR